MIAASAQEGIERSGRSAGASRGWRWSVFPGLLALGWMIYLLLAAGMTFFLTRPILADAAYFEAAMREMLLLVAVGLTLLWPLIRLSQEHARPVALLLLDAAVLLSLAQTVIWPLVGKTHWTVRMIFQLDALLIAWTLLAGGLISIGVCFHSIWARSVVMLLCAVSIFAVPLVRGADLLSDSPDWLAFASPLSAIWQLEGGGIVWPASVLELAGIVGCGGLALLAIGAVVRRRGPLGS